MHHSGMKGLPQSVILYIYRKEMGPLAVLDCLNGYWGATKECVGLGLLFDDYFMG
jgi:hypothetical protein